MYQEQTDPIIAKKKYTEPLFSRDPKNLEKIISWLNSAAISPGMLTQVVDLINFYGVAFLYQLEPVYARMTEAAKATCQKELELIRLHAEDLLGRDIPKELEFLMTAGNPKLKLKIIPHKVTENQRKFLDYWRKVRAGVAKIKSVPFTKGPQLQKIIDDFFEFELKVDADFNKFEDQAIDSYVEKVYQYSTEYQNSRNPQNQDFPIKDVYMGAEEVAQKSSLNLYPQKAQMSKPVPPVQHRNREVPRNVPQQSDQKRTPLCCRKFFFKDEVLMESQNLTLEFKDYSFPWSTNLIHTLKKTICGFLNRNGGILLIGVNEDNQTKTPVIRGRKLYNEALKQQIHVNLMAIAKTIYPNIISNLKLNVQFVPLKSQSTNQFIPGAYLIRIIVSPGERDCIYFFTQNQVDYYYFRTQKQVLRQRTTDVWEEYKNRIRKPQELPPKWHEGPCVQPQVGKPIYDNLKRVAERNHAYGHQQQHQGQQRQFDLRDRGLRNKSQMQEEQKSDREQFNPIIAGISSKPAGMVELVMQVLICLPFDARNPRVYLDRIIKNIKNIEIISYKELPEMAGFKLRKDDLQIFINNIDSLKRLDQKSEAIICLDPYTALFFKDDDLQHSTLRRAADELSQNKQIVFSVDKQHFLLRFAKTQHSVKAFLTLAIRGFKPRFTNK